MGRPRRSRKRSPASRRKTGAGQKFAARDAKAALHRELTTKRRGELAELAFTLRAATLGFGVSKPYGDSERYDAILDARDLRGDLKKIETSTAKRASTAHVGTGAPARLWRVQVKCSTQLNNGLYHANAHRRVNGRAVAYLPSEVDFFAIYIIPEDSWFILPIQAILGRTSLLFRRIRDPKPGLYDDYREAWHLLRPK